MTEAETIARAHAQGLKAVQRVHKALERLGHVARVDGGYALRKVA